VPADTFLLSFSFDELRLSKIAPDNRVKVAAISSPTSKEQWNHSLSAFSFKERRLSEKCPKTWESSFLFLSSSACKASISESRGDLLSLKMLSFVLLRRAFFDSRDRDKLSAIRRWLSMSPTV
jgi:hypothetical protein